MKYILTYSVKKVEGHGGEKLYVETLEKISNSIEEKLSEEGTISYKLGTKGASWSKRRRRFITASPVQK